MDNLTIRFTKPEDAAAIIAFLNQIGGETDNLLFGKNELTLTVEQEQAYLQNIAMSDNCCMLVGFIGDELVSTCSLQGYSRPRISHRAQISVAVRKEHWSKGIATSMMTSAITFAKGAGISVIELQVRSDNIAAIGLYKKMGFETIGSFKHFFNVNGVYHDALLMNLYL